MEAELKSNVKNVYSDDEVEKELKIIRNKLLKDIGNVLSKSKKNMVVFPLFPHDAYIGKNSDPNLTPFEFSLRKEPEKKVTFNKIL